MMNTKLLIDTIDTHTAGEPTRIVTSGLNTQFLSNGTVREKRDQFARDHDDIRKLLMKEPRGHDSMFGAVPVSPSDEEADTGVFFMDNDGYLDMCGHGTMGFLTALLEVGCLKPKAEFRIETPAGIVTAKPSLNEDESVKAVSLRNIGSFVNDRLEIDVEIGNDSTNVPLSIVYAGNHFAMIDVAEIDYSIERHYIDDLVQLGLQIRETLNDCIDLMNPRTGESNNIDLVEFYQSSGNNIDRNVTIFGNGLVDRSPCGTGTCAKMALLHDEGDLSEGEEYRHESVLGTEFKGRILQTETLDGETTVIPEITGSAYITGKHTFIKEQGDPLDGFKLNATD